MKEVRIILKGNKHTGDVFANVQARAYLENKGLVPGQLDLVKRLVHYGLAHDKEGQGYWVEEEGLQDLAVVCHLSMCYGMTSLQSAAEDGMKVAKELDDWMKGLAAETRTLAILQEPANG